MTITTRVFPISILYFFTFLLSSAIIAQGNYRFGRVDTADLAQTFWPADPNAEAAVLFHGNTFFVDLEDDGWLTLDVDRRVQLFKESAFDLGTVNIYFQPEFEEITTVKAAIYLPNGQTIKLKSKEFTREDYDDGVSLLSFTFPNLTEGAIIEYAYRFRTSDYQSFPTFYYQEDYPVRWAEFRADIPEYFYYFNRTTPNQTWAIDREEEVSRVSVGGTPIDYQILHYALENIPAFRSEPFANNEIDSIPQTALFVSYVHFPFTAPINYNTTWKRLAKSLHRDFFFGRKYKHFADVKQAFNEIFPSLRDATSQREQAKIVYDLLAEEMSWDGQYTVKTENSLNDVWANKQGSAGEINMLLLGILQQLEIEAHPVLVSLRGTGSPITKDPIFEQFDHVMVWANLDGEEMLMDVYDPYLELGWPRFEALNGQAWVGDPEDPRWIDLEVPKMSRKISVDMKIATDGMAQVRIKSTMDGYDAQHGRYLLSTQREPWHGPLMNTVMELFPGAKFNGRKVEPLNQSGSGTLALQLDFTARLGKIEDDFMYLNPVLFHSLDNELSQGISRTSPFDVGYPYLEEYEAEITIPAGYDVESLPANQLGQSQDGGFTVGFRAVEAEGKINVYFTVDFDKAIFPVGAYGNLRAVLSGVIAAQQSLIVFKKISE